MARKAQMREGAVPFTPLSQKSPSRQRVRQRSRPSKKAAGANPFGDRDGNYGITP